MTPKAAQLHADPAPMAKWHLVAREVKGMFATPVRVAGCYRPLFGPLVDAVGVPVGDRCSLCKGWP